MAGKDSKTNFSLSYILKIVFVGITSTAIYLFYNIYQGKKILPENLKPYFRPWSDLLIMMGCSLFVWGYKILMKRLTGEILVEAYIRNNDKHISTQREKVMNYGANLLWYFSMLVILIGFIIPGNELIPKPLGGSMPDDKNIFWAWPRTQHSTISYVYFHLQFGSKFYSFMETLLTQRGYSDFWEMMLHHLMAVTLMLYCYFLNWIDLGISVLLLHDPGDFSFVVIKMYRYLLPEKYKPSWFRAGLTILCYALFIGPRVILQIFCMFYRGVEVVYIDYFMAQHPEIGQEFFDKINPVVHFIFFTLTLLCLLNIYWCVLMVGYILKYVGGMKIVGHHGTKVSTVGGGNEKTNGINNVKNTIDGFSSKAKCS